MKMNEPRIASGDLGAGPRAPRSRAPSEVNLYDNRPSLVM